jgi:sulfur relay (sulfurtransferase) complex TusBCD TusD component (DsrE family)
VTSCFAESTVLASCELAVPIAGKVAGCQVRPSVAAVQCTLGCAPHTSQTMFGFNTMHVCCCGSCADERGRDTRPRKVTPDAFQQQSSLLAATTAELYKLSKCNFSEHKRGVASAKEQA